MPSGCRSADRPPKRCVQESLCWSRRKRSHTTRRRLGRGLRALRSRACPLSHGCRADRAPDLSLSLPVTIDSASGHVGRDCRQAPKCHSPQPLSRHIRGGTAPSRSGPDTCLGTRGHSSGTFWGTAAPGISDITTTCSDKSQVSDSLEGVTTKSYRRRVATDPRIRHALVSRPIVPAFKGHETAKTPGQRPDLGFTLSRLWDSNP